MPASCTLLSTQFVVRCSQLAKPVIRGSESQMTNGGIANSEYRTNSEQPLRHNLRYSILPHPLAVCRLAPDAHVPAWASQGQFFCVARTGDELSVVCEEDRVPEGIRVERGWKALKLEGPFPFSLTGVLASFLEPLAQAGIPSFAISTFDTDYILVKRDHVEGAVRALAAAGHQIV